MVIVKKKHKYIIITSNDIYKTHTIKNNKCLDPIINMSIWTKGKHRPNQLKNQVQVNIKLNKTVYRKLYNL